MIEGIIELLKMAKGDTELIRIAQGKYLLPDSFKSGINQVKKEAQWRKR
jgi:hypothetical protein